MAQLSDFTFPTNPLANGDNMFNVFLPNPYATVPVAGTLVTNAGATTATLTASLPANNTLGVFRVTITDGKGVEAVGTLDTAAIATPVVISTATLDATTDWSVAFYWEEPTTSQDDPKFGFTSYKMEGAKDSVTYTYTTDEVEGTLAVNVALVVNGVVTVAKALVADTGTAAFGVAVPQNSVAYALVYFENTATGQKPLRVLSVQDNAAAMTVATAFNQTIPYPLVVATGEESPTPLRVNLDTSALGAIAASSININNNTTNALYVVNFTATIV